MTWNDVLSHLNEMSAKELEQTAFAHPSWGETLYRVASFRLSGADGDACPVTGILADGHWFIELDGL